MNSMGDLSKDEKETGKAVKARFDEYLAKLENQDLTNIKDFYSNSENFKWTEERGINSIQSKNEFASADDLVEYVLNNYTSSALNTIKMTCPKTVRVTDESHAMVFMSYKQLKKDAKGVKTKYQGHFLIHMLKEGNEWKFLTGDDQRVELDPDQ
jgi:hypothetical protein